MKRKQNIFLFFDERDSDDMDLKLVRLYVNKFIIDEDEQSEIQAVIPLEKHLLSNYEEKEACDQDAVYQQLEKLGYNYFIKESYVTHFIILPGFPISWSISPWIDYWFNELAKQHHDAAVDAKYRFVCTSLEGSKETSKFYSKKEAKVAYEDYYRRLGYPAKSINSDNSIPIDIDVEEFEQAITAELSPEPDQRWVHNFYEKSNTEHFFFYQSLTDHEVRQMNKQELDLCENLGLKPELDTIFRRLTGRRYSYIITPKHKCNCLECKCLNCKCKKFIDQRVLYLGSEPIEKPGRLDTKFYLREENTYPVIIKGDYEVLFKSFLEAIK